MKCIFHFVAQNFTPFTQTVKKILHSHECRDCKVWTQIWYHFLLLYNWSFHSPHRTRPRTSSTYRWTPSTSHWRTRITRQCHSWTHARLKEQWVISRVVQWLSPTLLPTCCCVLPWLGSWPAEPHTHTHTHRHTYIFTYVHHTFINFGCDFCLFCFSCDLCAEFNRNIFIEIVFICILSYKKTKCREGGDSNVSLNPGMPCYGYLPLEG